MVPAPITAPQALRLANEPKANVLRYDTLRSRLESLQTGSAPEAPSLTTEIPDLPEVRHAS